MKLPKNQTCDPGDVFRLVDGWTLMGDPDSAAQELVRVQESIRDALILPGMLKWLEIYALRKDWRSVDDSCLSLLEKYTDHPVTVTVYEHMIQSLNARGLQPHVEQFKLDAAQNLFGWALKHIEGHKFAEAGALLRGACKFDESIRQKILADPMLEKLLGGEIEAG